MQHQLAAQYRALFQDRRFEEEMKGKRESESAIGQVDVYFKQFKVRAITAKDESSVELQAVVQ